MTGSGDVENSTEAFAILVFAGGIMLLLGAVWGFLDPQSKTAWATAFVGGAMAIAGSAWGWVSLNDYVFAGADAAAVHISQRVGLYLTVAGGSVGVIVSIIGRLGTTERL